jgi:hypothetical protein
MNLTAVRRNVMSYRDHEFRYDAEQTFEVESDIRQDGNGKQYIQKRSVRPKRRRSPKASHPGCGMGARRGRKWNW